ncbi:MAG: DegT/DnrJ/EryC1/StrS family aminotransferase [Candidatus Micrarchaeota archaeon]
MKREVPIGFADVGEKEEEYVLDSLRNKRLSYGKYTHMFENEFSKEHGCKYGMVCNSGTSALRVAIAALKETCNWEDGSEVLVPAVTFVATSNVLIQQNLKPVFVDVDPLTYNIDPNMIEEKITKKTVGIMPVHLCGLPCEMGPIMEIARKHNLRVVEDSAETMFAKYKGKPVGSFGDVGCFSMYVAHILVSGVGGITTTNDADLAVVMKSIMNHGRDSVYISIDDDDNITDPAKMKFIMERRFRFVRLGYSFRLTELEGALAHAQFERRREILFRRKENAKWLTDGLSKHSEFLQLPTVPKDRDHAFMFYPIVVKDGADFSRDELTLHLEMKGIETRFLLPLINQPIYIKLFGELESRYPVAKNLNANAFYIGCHQHISKEDVEYVLGVFGEFFKKRAGK